jgi:hypothetical protein
VQIFFVALSFLLSSR